MPEQPDRQRILGLRARAATIRRAATYMSLQTAKHELEGYAAGLEQEADTLETDMHAAAVARAETVRHMPTGPELLAEMKADAAADPPPETDDTSPDGVKALFKSRAERLRELAASHSTNDKDLLLAIAAEYEELVNALAQTDAKPT